MQRAVLLAVLIALLSLLLLEQVVGNEARLSVALDGSHFPIFAAISVLLAAMTRRVDRPCPDGRRCAFALGVAIVSAQSPTGRRGRYIRFEAVARVKRPVGRLALDLPIESAGPGRRAPAPAKVAELVDALDLGSSG